MLDREELEQIKQLAESPEDHMFEPFLVKDWKIFYFHPYFHTECIYIQVNGIDHF